MEKIHFKFPPLGDNELRIKTTYTGICHSDVHKVMDHWYKVQNRPIIPGHEILGIVTHVGKDVKDWQVGEKAGFGCFRDFCGACKSCKSGNDHLCTDKNVDKVTFGGKYWGGYADQVQQPARMFFKIPEGIPDKLVPSLFCAGITAYSTMKAFIKPG